MCTALGDTRKTRNDELITYDYFMKRLFELFWECRHENYLSEILIPFFRMCSPEGIKIVPVFNDRKSGPRSKKETKCKQRMDTITASTKPEEYIVPDYIYVSSEYSFDDPVKPYVMIEVKSPVLMKREEIWYYTDLSYFIRENADELMAEINACEIVIFTDGITWIFLTKEDISNIDKIKNSKDKSEETFKGFRLVNMFDKEIYGKRMKKVNDKVGKIAEWENLKGWINTLLNNCKQSNK